MMIRKRLASLLALPLLAAPAFSLQAQALVGHWRFDETTGNILSDSSGNGLDAVIQSGISIGGPGSSPTSGNCAKFNAALSGHAAINEQPPLAALRDRLSVAAWVRFEPGTSNLARIFAGEDSAWSCGLTATGMRFTTRFIRDYDLAVSVPPSTWVHLAYVFDANHDVTFYLDGVVQGTVLGTQPSQASNGRWLLGALRPSSEFWHGYMDDVQVYEGELTPAEVLQLYQNPGVTVDPQPAEPVCFGDGTGGFCPCGNNGAPGEGCANSTTLGARLDATGSRSVGSDDLQLTATQLPPGRPAVLFAGRQLLGTGGGLIFGDGLRCAGVSIRRLGTRMSDAAGSASWGPALALQLGAQPAERHQFQVWYQDPVGQCGLGFNTSHALQVDYLP